MTRTQVLIVVELYGLISGEAAPPSAVAQQLAVPEGEVRRVDREVRGRLKKQAASNPATNPDAAPRESPRGGDGKGLTGALDRALGADEANAPVPGS